MFREKAMICSDGGRSENVCWIARLEEKPTHSCGREITIQPGPCQTTLNSADGTKAQNQFFIGSTKKCVLSMEVDFSLQKGDII